jgi:D-alanyl-lipoteichoic acid acyltransferase DltB (MBOAT superfamily)
MAVVFYYIIKPRYRILFLTLISCGFIATYNPYLLVHIIAFSIINYYTAIIIEGTRFKKTFFRIGIFFNLAQLIGLRYSSFAIDPILQLFNSTISVSKYSEILVPVGISYFTLQGIGYLINIKMGWEKSEKRFINLLLYLTFYPKFLSGPIERSNHFLPQLDINTSFDANRISEGLRIALFGFFKKIAIANQLAPFITRTYADIGSASEFSLCLTILIQPLYLYFDFSGYTDIAIGFAKAFGLDLLPNFNRPFFSENMTTFWKRFHISLSSWFNDYVFRQTSFKLRKWGIFATISALLITWTLFGIWHGAGWNFMMLGLIQALAIIYEFFTKRWRLKSFSYMPIYLRIWLGRIVTYLFYGGSLVFFFSHDIKAGFLFYKGLFENNVQIKSVHDLLHNIHKEISVSAAIFVIACLLVEFFRNDFRDTYNKMETLWLGNSIISRLFRWVIYYLTLFITYALGKEVGDFIYFQF